MKVIDMHSFLRWLAFSTVVWVAPTAFAGELETPDERLARYLRAETTAIEERCLADIRTVEDWDGKKGEYRRQLREMLGLDPLPERTDLKPVTTRTLEEAEFTVENLHFQSSPGLYVTGNLYLPKGLKKPAPAVLYLCGHGKVVKDGVSLGNKTHYQHHGAWLARLGYVCLVIDTLQLGEIEGVHHGTYKEGRWWWLSRGYTPAGVEAWNCIRALDYLETRSEVDPRRIGVTGRSGGGAYSWWIAALDDRVRAAVPVAGITDLRNHVVDGVVDGHCDCMFMVNTYRWDYPQVAALNYPRPLMVANTDRDQIFPLDGVYRTYRGVRRLYELGKRPADVAFAITPGQHVDTQELQLPALVWFDQHLNEDRRPVEIAAKKFFEPEQLKVFDQLPTAERNTTIDETFVPPAGPFEPPKDAAAWEAQKQAWTTALREKTFRGWPAEAPPLDLRTISKRDHEGLTLTVQEFVSEHDVVLQLSTIARTGSEGPALIVLNPLDQSGWEDFARTRDELFPREGKAGDVGEEAGSLRKLLLNQNWEMAWMTPRGVGPDQWEGDAKRRTQIRRRFYLLGQSLEGMQAWDIRRAMQAVRSAEGASDTPLWIQAKGPTGVLALHASLSEPPVTRFDLYDVPTSYAPDGPALLNVLRVLDVPQTLALAAERSQVVLYRESDGGFEYLKQTAAALGWPAKRVQFRKPAQEAR